MPATEIEDYLVRLEKEITEFKEELIRISWYMRGGVSVTELLHSYSFDDREAMYTIIKDNLETTKATQMPLV